MKDALLRIMDGYGSAKLQPFSGSTLAGFIRSTAPAAIRTIAAIPANYRLSGSAGQGTWAEIPWICLFDRGVSVSAQSGYYVAYLFRSDMSGVYLSLNMGWTQFADRYKSLEEARKNIKSTAEACRMLLRSSLSDFSHGPIDLVTDRVLGRGYELGHICGKFYSRTAIPEDGTLVDDLRNLIGVYRELKGFLKRTDITDLLGHWREEERRSQEAEDTEYQRDVERAEPARLEPTPQNRPDYIEARGQKRWRKNPAIAKASLVSSNYECQGNPAHSTFTSRATGRNYVEAHHLVPMEFQEQFQWSLDVDANIVPLCPNCHRLLHNATQAETASLLRLLFYRREQALVQRGISLSLDELARFYHT